MFNSKERKAERLQKILSPNVTISRRSYNLTLGLTVLWGLLINLVMCSIEGVVSFYESVNPILFIIGYFILCFIGVMIVAKSDKPVISFIGYNMICVPIGVIVSACVYYYGGIGSGLVQQAFLITCLVTGIMVAASIMFPNFFKKIGGVLFISLCGLLIASLILFFLGIDTIIISWISAAIFSLYIGYDFYRSQQYPPSIDNAIDSAVDIYLDIINLFLDILRILASSKRRD